MNTNRIAFFVVCLLLLGSLAVAQNNYDKPEVVAKGTTYNVTLGKTSVVVENKNNKIRKEKLTYDYRYLDYTGFDLNAAQRNVLNVFRTQLSVSQKSMIRKQGRYTLLIFLRKNGKVEEVSFLLPRDSPITPDDLERMEKIITKMNVPVLKSELYTNVNYLYAMIKIDGSML